MIINIIAALVLMGLSFIGLVVILEIIASSYPNSYFTRWWREHIVSKTYHEED